MTIAIIRTVKNKPAFGEYENPTPIGDSRKIMFTNVVHVEGLYSSWEWLASLTWNGPCSYR